MAGQLTPVRFGLGGDQGMSVIAGGSPTYTPISCSTLRPTGATTATQAGKPLAYDGSKNLYTYSWMVDKSLRKTCGRFDLTLIDGTTHSVLVRFK